MKRRILKIIIIGAMAYIEVTVIALCWIYALKGDDMENYLKDFWNWYKTMFI